MTNGPRVPTGRKARAAQGTAQSTFRTGAKVPALLLYTAPTAATLATTAAERAEGRHNCHARLALLQRCCSLQLNFLIWG